MINQSFIQCENLIKIYRISDQAASSDASLEVQALQGLDLTVAEGEMIAVVGASGSGKSTLLNILGGLDRPNGGRAQVDKQDLGSLSQRGLDQYRRKTVGFVWQYGARNMVPYLTTLENIQLPMTLSGKVGKRSRQYANELLNQVCLGDRMSHRLEELSGGEQQRVAVAIALANRPRLLLADEPTGELDTATARTIYDLFRDLNQKLGLTIVIVSHDPGIAQHVDRVVAVRDGKLASESVRIKSSMAGSNMDPMHTFEELAILDSAGRLSIPREHLDQFHIRRRVRLEITDEGILIRPAMSDQSDHGHAVDNTDKKEFSADAGKRRRLPAWLDRPRRSFEKAINKLHMGRKDAE
jgi:putative ABC transport system ATP-binding protein